MTRFTAFLLPSLCVLLAACASPDVRYSDLDPGTTVSFSADAVTLHLGHDHTASACWTRPKARTDGQTVYVTGHRTLREQSRTLVVPLPSSSRNHAVSVVWINPDGSEVPLPTRP